MAASRSVLVLVGPKGSGKTYVGTLTNKELGVPFLRVEPIFLENLRKSLSAARRARSSETGMCSVWSLLRTRSRQRSSGARLDRSACRKAGKASEAPVDSMMTPGSRLNTEATSARTFA
jgi:hypothetical protein